VTIQTSSKSPGIIEACSLVARPTAPRDYFMGKLIYGQCLGMLYGQTGIGKTWLSLLLAACQAGGADFMRYRCQKAKKVAYVDGEMLSDSIRERVIQVCTNAKFSVQEGQLKFISPDLFASNMVPNIADAEAQAWYDKTLDDRDVLIIDNLMSCSQRIGRDDDLQTWMRILPWLIKWRVKGKAVVIVHHSGKAGTQLGTSVREQVMDWIAYMRRPLDYQPEDGAKFNVSFDKGRNLSGEDAEPFAVSLINQPDGTVTWKWNGLSDEYSGAVADMKRLKMNDKDIAAATGLSLYKVKQIIAENAFTNEPTAKKQEARSGYKDGNDEMF
jgi:RecA-family ATPase